METDVCAETTDPVINKHAAIVWIILDDQQD